MNEIETVDKLELSFAELSESPIGPISFVAGSPGLRLVSFETLIDLRSRQPDQKFQASLKGFINLGDALAEMNEYLHGLRKQFTVYPDWTIFSSFQRRVLEVTAEIPYGEVRTYSEMARLIGAPKAARAVGRALAQNPVPIIIPCHRVISADRGLRGYIGGMERKAFLLRLEGHRVSKDGVVVIP